MTVSKGDQASSHPDLVSVATFFHFKFLSNTLDVFGSVRWNIG
jgi:hypothetical protein